jgi:hypothetical protein
MERSQDPEKKCTGAAVVAPAKDAKDQAPKEKVVITPSLIIPIFITPHLRKHCYYAVLTF